MPMVRTVFQPDTPREVSEHEAAQLEREGLLLPLDEEQPAPDPAPAAASKTAAPATTSAKEAASDGGKQAQ